MTATSEDFRQALARFPSGVTIVTVRAGDTVHGLTVSAFASVSPEPPLIAVAIDHRHRAHELLGQDGAVFAVNILGQEHVELSNRFAWVKNEDRFAVGSWKTAVTGAPVLEDALSWLDCSIYDRFVAGTHTVYVGQVEATPSEGDGRPPLVYWKRGYRRLDLDDEAE